jgi:hypothetical protein
MIPSLLRYLLLPILLSTMVLSNADAQFRTLPQNVKFARVGESQPLPFVQLDGQLIKLAPGGVIYDQENRTVLHGALPRGARVAYSVEIGGDIGRIYILTAREQALIDSKQ